MFKYRESTNHKETKLYNKILNLSRNKLLYTRLSLSDTFQNRINLIFIHICFVFILIKYKKNTLAYKEFYQKMFDLIFRKIELNMREIGHGDVTVNKNMKFLVKSFYNILLNCENYKTKNLNEKKLFLLKYLSMNKITKSVNNTDLVSYFDKYQAFCLDLSSDNVLKGEINYNYI